MQHQFCVLLKPILQKSTDSALFQTRSQALHICCQTQPGASQGCSGPRTAPIPSAQRPASLPEEAGSVGCVTVTHWSPYNWRRFLVSGISSFLFPADGEATNVKEHAWLFSHACQGNASSLSLGKM